ncbi:Pga1p SCDLUD_002843 [Saccharomycodes ludwigii]|uniref:Pga1p n=1 Tax=Saccharomycodes ludwigii TaxID=36035 RepID=UPI001E867877|nr:hypothetical protein SCDLUD_002843 [Saccharomycodes ludwigii]KAH3901351.1 hypothetical protein SCDLUD_002843 [Saccharomycodes ludwigii]
MKFTPLSQAIRIIIQCLFSFLILTEIKLVFANTETTIVEVPSDFPIDLIKTRIPSIADKVYQEKKEQFNYISLFNTNHITKSFKLNIDGNNNLTTPSYFRGNDKSKKSIQTFEILGYRPRHKYMIKICWSAIFPVSISDITTKFIDNDNGKMSLLLEFRVNPSSNNIRFALFSSSAQKDEQEQIHVPVNISIDELFLGIPVTLYSTILYLVAVVLFTSFMLYIFQYKKKLLFQFDNNKEYSKTKRC